MHFSGTAHPWRASCKQARLSWHAALLLSSLRLASVESYKSPDSSSETRRCETTQAEPDDYCPDAAPASSEAVAKILLQRSASVASPQKQMGNSLSLKDVLELAHSADRIENKKAEEAQEPENDSSIDEAENDPANDEAENDKKEDRRRRKSGESSLDTSSETRPNSGKNKSESIGFGVYLKGFHGINFADDTFSCDLVLTMRWFDKRALKILQDDEESVTMPTALAKKNIWLPDVAVTNRALKGYDIISSSVTVSADGQVSKTERMFVVVRSAFDVRSFPFDNQTLSIRVASTSYMADEVQLSVLEDSDTTGFPTDLFNISGFSVNSVGARAFEETDGNLRKSRGSLDISIVRFWMPLVFSALVPNFLLLCVSWTVFFFPLQPVFIMPRVGTSLITLLTSMTLSVRTSQLLPDKRSGDVWIEYFEETCRTMMFITVCLNIFVEVIHHEWSLTDLSSKMTTEVRHGYGCLICLMAILWFLAFLMRDVKGFQFGTLLGEGMSPVVIITRVLLFVGLLLYFAVMLSRARSASKKAAREEIKKQVTTVTRENLAAPPQYAVPQYADSGAWLSRSPNTSGG